VSAVKIHTPVSKLAKLLRTPGGLPVAEALQRAGANLQTLKKDCLAELKTTLDEADAVAARGGAAYDADLTAELYGVVSAPIGIPTVCDLASIDTALISLADLLDHLKTHRTWDANAVAVHLRACRLLLHTEGTRDAAGTQQVLAGLKKVSQRYARPQG
jgi:hypothetical protein